MCVFSLRPMRKFIYIYKCGLSAGAIHTACVGLMWLRRRRRWTGIGPALDRRLMFDAFSGLLL